MISRVLMKFPQSNNQEWGAKISKQTNKNKQSVAAGVTVAQT